MCPLAAQLAWNAGYRLLHIAQQLLANANTVSVQKKVTYALVLSTNIVGTKMVGGVTGKQSIIGL